MPLRFAPSHGVWSWLITQIHPNSTLSQLVQEFKPLIFQDGKPVPFPEPTKACCLSFQWSFGCGCHFSIRRLEDRGWKSMLELDAVHQKLQTRSGHFLLHQRTMNYLHSLLMLVTIYLYIIRNYIIELYNIYSCLRFSSSLSYWCELTADFRRKRVRSERAASQLFGRVAAENGGWQLCLQRVWCLVGTTEHGALSESGLGEPQGFWYSRSAFALIFLQLMRSSKDQNVSSWNIVPRLWKPLWSFPGKLNSIILGAYLALKRLQPS